MPKLHEYRSKRGMYVKARHGNSMVTYQLTPAAVAELRRHGMGDGSHVSPDALHSLVAAGLAYTHGSGAGIVDNPTPPPPAKGTVTVSVSEKAKLRKQKQKEEKQRQRQSGGRLYPPSCYGDTRPAPTPPSRPYTPPVLPPTPPPPLPTTPAVSGDRLFPASCYADYQDSTPPALSAAPAQSGGWLSPGWSYVECPASAPPDQPAARPAPSVIQPASAASSSSPGLAAAGPALVTREPFDWWRLLSRAWAVISYEVGGIPMWLWLLMLVGVLVPGLLIANVVGRR